MRATVLLLITLLLCGCRRPTSPSDTDQQQGNPKARPEAGVKKPSGKQPKDDKAGRDPHTDLPVETPTK
jgi:hypothetical protein